MNQWRFQWFVSARWALFTLRVNFVRIKKGAANLRHPSESISNPRIFFKDFFWGGSEVPKSQTNNGEVLRTLCSVLMIFFKTKSLPVTVTFRKVRCLEVFEFSRPLNKQHTDFIIPQPFFLHKSCAEASGPNKHLFVVKRFSENLILTVQTFPLVNLSLNSA